MATAAPDQNSQVNRLSIMIRGSSFQSNFLNCAGPRVAQVVNRRMPASGKVQNISTAALSAPPNILHR